MTKLTTTHLNIAASHITVLRRSLCDCIEQMELARARDMMNHPHHGNWNSSGKAQQVLDQAKQVLRPEWPPR